jgi:hypothetical protein
MTVHFGVRGFMLQMYEFVTQGNLFAAPVNPSLEHTCIGNNKINNW